MTNLDFDQTDRRFPIESNRTRSREFKAIDYQENRTEKIGDFVLWVTIDPQVPGLSSCGAWFYKTVGGMNAAVEHSFCNTERMYSLRVCETMSPQLQAKIELHTH